MSDIELGPGKRARAAYSFDEIAIVPSRRTRDLEEVSISWQIDAYKFELPFLAAPMDSVVSPETAIAIGKAGGLGVKMIDGNGVFLPESKRGLPTPAVAFYKIFGLSSLFPHSKTFSTISFSNKL